MNKYSINRLDMFYIIGLAMLTNCFSELLSYLLIYRKKEYKELFKSIDLQTKKLESFKSSISKNTYAKVNKKEKKYEEDLKSLNFKMMRMRMASMFIIGLFVIFFMSVFSSVYQGVVVAKLPFEPFRLIYNITHRGILSQNKTDCSFIFIYILSNLVIRPILQKLLGVEAPRNSNNQFANMFTPTSMQK